ncbi:MAG TPA: glycosyltransferase [Rhodanobacteraceae bacterium]
MGMDIQRQPVISGGSVTSRGYAHAAEPGAARPLRLLVFTSLYPNAAQPRHCVFVEERLRHLVASGRVAATVVAPVPWFPSRHSRFGKYALFAQVPKQEERYGIRILHPRYPVIPKFGMNMAPALMVRALLPMLRKLSAAQGEFDLVDAHYFYPDGVAATRLGAALHKPVVITARGTDVNVIAEYPSPRTQIRRAAADAAVVITVSEALRHKVIDLGVPSGKVTALRNGVDLERFRPLDRVAIRAELNLDTPTWLTVSHLVERKGVHLVVAALAQVPDAVLLVVGAGPEAGALRDLAKRLCVSERVRFLGAIDHHELCRYYNAADVQVLASASEGMPNVVLESLACGTPVIAAPFESARELIKVPEAGEVTESHGPEAIVSAWQRLWARRPDRAATRAFAQQLGWDPVVEAQCALYARTCANFRQRECRGVEV